MQKLSIVMLFLILTLVVVLASAQESLAPSPAITAENVAQLQSVERIDFADYESEFDIGWFALDASGERFAVSDSRGTLYLVADGQKVEIGRPGDDDRTYPGSPVDVAFDSDGQIYAVHIVDGQTYVNFRPIDLQQPVGAWVGDVPTQIFVETAAFGENTAQIVALTVPQDSPDLEIAEVIPYVPGEDESAVVRIGRIPRPYAVTSSLDAIVKLWNLETGETLYKVDNGTGEPSVFGAINLPPTHLVWRDNANQSLYLLNFETGENQYIDDLGGEYAQWYFLSSDASVILAVNLGFEPNVVAWDVKTGERTILGEYRECNRPQPDMTRLSEDGTTLVIGCDTGLDIWRIVPEGEN